MQQTFYERSTLLGEDGHFAFLSPPLGEGLGLTYAVHLRLTGELVVDFLLVIIDLFARCFRFVTIHAIDRRADGRTDRHFAHGYTAPAAVNRKEETHENTSIWRELQQLTWLISTSLSVSPFYNTASSFTYAVP